MLTARRCLWTVMLMSSGLVCFGCSDENMVELTPDNAVKGESGGKTAIYITSDKPNYAADEIPSVTMFAKIPDSVWVEGCVPISLEQLTGDAWIGAGPLVKCKRQGIQTVPADSGLSATFPGLQAGTYRAKVIFKIGDTCSPEQEFDQCTASATTIYSEPFDVEEGNMDLSVTSSKLSYATDETITIMATAHIPEPVWVEGCVPIAYEKWTGDAWIADGPLVKCKRKGIAMIPSSGIKRDFSPFSSGNYRAKVVYKVGIACNINQEFDGCSAESITVYSEPFTVGQGFPAVEVVTDKAQYQQGEVIDALIKQTIRGVFWVEGCQPFSFEKWVDNVWVDQGYLGACKRQGIKRISSEGIADQFTQDNAGKYRIKVVYKAGSECNDNQEFSACSALSTTIYSEPFTVVANSIVSHSCMTEADCRDINVPEFCRVNWDCTNNQCIVRSMFRC